MACKLVPELGSKVKIIKKLKSLGLPKIFTIINIFESAQLRGREMLGNQLIDCVQPSLRPRYTLILSNLFQHKSSRSQNNTITAPNNYFLAQMNFISGLNFL